MNRFAKSTWVTRGIPGDLRLSWQPLRDATEVGQLLECEVISPSLHGRVETVDGSRAKLYPGDRIACVVANRYATAMLEGVGRVTGDVIHLLSASGVCGEVVSQTKPAKPTTLRVLSQAVLDGVPVNVRSFALPAPDIQSEREPVWIAVLGSAMNAGKTTACAGVVNAVRAAGYRVAAAKLSGTASARDVCSLRDAGADPVLDFLDMGWASTDGCDAGQLCEIVTGLGAHLRASSPDVVVLEVADGLLQRETDLLVSGLLAWLGEVGVVFAAQESLAAVAGVHLLGGHGYEVLAVTGVLTNSPLACREVELAGAGPCIATADLGHQLLPRIADMVASARQRRVGAFVA